MQDPTQKQQDQAQKQTEVHIIGAGFSGLTLAYLLVRKNIKVHIYDKKNSEGGLIATDVRPGMLVEFGANGLLCNPEIEMLFKDLGLEMLTLKKESAKKFFYRKKIRQWPLSFFETAGLILTFIKSLFKGRSWLKPSTRESVRNWGRRVLGGPAADHLIATALQGVYAGNPTEMSASLVVGSFFRPKTVMEKTAPAPHSRRRKGTVAPAQGMGQLMNSLRKFLENSGAIFHWNSDWNSTESQKIFQSLESKGILVLAVSMKDLSKLWSLVSRQKNPFQGLPMIPLVRVTAAFKNPKKIIQGFGLLVDPDEKVRTLGILSNTMNFENRGDSYNETWMLGGTKDPQVIQLSDLEIQKLILEERKKILKADDPMSEIAIIRWPEALPHYTSSLEEALEKVILNPRCHLTGNYLGALGLSRIYDENRLLAERIQKDIEA